MPITQEQIKQFMEGTDPMERIVNITYTYGDDFVRVYYKDEEGKKFVRQEKFYPFVWATRHACKKLCGGNKNELVRLMNKYGVRVKQLRNTSVNGEVRHEFDDGYVFMFYATRPMAQKDFTRFFRDAKNPIYAKRDNLGREIYDEPEDERQYLSVSAVEQFMIATGKRFFKGYDDYDQLLRLIFDLETEGLNPETDRITHIGVRSNKGFEKIIYVEGKTKEELDIDEFYAILEFFKIIAALQPDIITAHNGENFDWNFILTRFNKVNTVDDRTYTIEEVCEKIFGKDKGIIFKDERESILKLGGEIETFHATHVPETIITDSLHAVRRAQALDSNMQRADLKYSTKYFEMNKPNRVYIPGNKINTTGEDTTNQYALNDTNGKWYIIDEKHPLKEGYDVVSGREIVRRYLLDDLWECDKVEWKCNTTNFLICKLLPIPYSKCVTMGTAGQWKGLMMAWSYRNDLAIPKAVNTGKFTGGLSRLLKTGYIPNAIKLDFNSLYPSIILTWGISDTTDLMGTMLSFLEYILTTRETFKGLKKNADNKIKEIEPKVIEKNATEDEERVYQKLKAEFAVADGKQNQMKVLGNSFFGSYGSNNGSVFPWKSIKCAEQTTCTGRQSLRLMISHFKKLGYEPIVGDTDGFNFQLPSKDKYRYTAEHPYIGKGANREVKAGKEYTGYEADVAEFNDLYMCRTYNEKSVQKMGLGIDEVVSATINFKRKNYADYFPEKPEDKQIKMVGNTIKSKGMAEYIAKFLNKGILLLLQGKGQEFIKYYYEYLTAIYNYQIPLKDIASKGKIKKSLREYIEGTKELTKAGRPKSRQAWYELAIQNNLIVNNGDTIYYINTGEKKSDGSDVKKITHYYRKNKETNEVEEITKEVNREYPKYRKKAKEEGILPKDMLEREEWLKENYNGYYTEDEIILNCVYIPQEMIDSDEDVMCTEEMKYNTAKYIDQFNNRIRPLLVCFSKEIRDQIQIKSPENIPYFTEKQCELVSGEPDDPSDQDTFEQLMTMEDKEIKFWDTYNMVPPFLEECGMGKWEDILADYRERKQKELELGIDKEREAYEGIIDGLSKEDCKEFAEEKKMPSALNKICTLENNEFKSIKFEGVVLGNIYDIIDKDFVLQANEELPEE